MAKTEQIKNVKILFPGRHHIITKYQKDYMKKLILEGISGSIVEEIIFAVTSSNHSNTRRNPLPLYLRAIQIENTMKNVLKECANSSCKIKIVPIPDVKQTDQFAKYIVSQIAYIDGEKINPTNTILACSTPSIIKQFEKIGFKNLPVELDLKYYNTTKKEKYLYIRPWEVIELIVKNGKSWRTISDSKNKNKNDENWKKYSSEESQEIFLYYDLGDKIIELFNDSLLNDDADITDTRDYQTYAKGMDNVIHLKFQDIEPFVVEGKIVDVGCGTGALVNELSKHFQESDVIGIEATRKFYEYCKMQEYATPLVYFYRRNVINQNFKNNTINTFIYSSVMHELHSYINNDTVKKILKNSYTQLTHKGRIIIRDVIGPDNKNQIVYMKLNNKNGLVPDPSGDIKKISTYNKFFRFIKDFKPRKIKFKETTIENEKYIVLRLQDAYEYISKMNYTDNWHSEMHEEFGYWNFADWENNLEKIGFKIVSGSKTFSNPYIIEKSYSGKAELYIMKNKKLIPINYPPTNIIIAAEKP